MSIQSVCDRIIRAGFCLLFIIVPLILTPWNYELFEFNKMLAVYAITTVIGAAWILKMLHLKEIRITRTPLDIPLLVFGLSQLISTLFSMDPHISWFGYYSRFNGGMISVICYVILFFAFTTNFTLLHNEKNEGRNSTKQYTNRTLLLHVVLATAFLVALYGVAEHYGIDRHLWVQDVQNRVFSTLGQPNWLAAYLVALFPLALAMFIQSIHSDIRMMISIRWKTLISRLPSYFLLLAPIIFFLVLLYTRSRSGLMGFAIMSVIFWINLFLIGNKKKIRELFFVINGILFFIVFFNGSNVDKIDRYATFAGWKTIVETRILNQHPPQPAVQPDTEAKPAAPLLETGGTESGVIRKYVWQAAAAAWESSMKNFLIGSGTETFAFVFFRFKPVGHNMTSEWDFLYNKAHNEYLNYLATTGLFGLGSYLVFVILCIYWMIRWQIILFHNEDIPPKERMATQMLESAIVAGFTSILVTNFFGFSVVVIQLLLFLLPAFSFLIYRKSAYPGEVLPQYHLSLPVSAKMQLNCAFAAAGAACVMLLCIANGWYADKLFANGARLSKTGYFGPAIPYLDSAVELNPFEPMFRDERATAYAGLAIGFLEQEKATEAADLIKVAISDNERAIRTSPDNIGFWKTRTKIFFMLSTYQPAFTATALDTLVRSQQLSPNDPKIMYNIAILYGRLGDYVKSIEYLTKAKAIKPNYRDVYNALSMFYRETHQPDQSRGIVQEYLIKVDPDDKEFKEKLGQQ